MTPLNTSRETIRASLVARAARHAAEMDKFNVQLDAHSSICDSEYLDGVYLMTARDGYNGQLITVAPTVATIDYAYRVAQIAVSSGHTDLTLTAKEITR